MYGQDLGRRFSLLDVYLQLYNFLVYIYKTHSLILAAL
jgi:hypothetical protein